ncbi:TRAFAC clade GTPase domain-containing protein [Sphingomonas sp. Mn802worker]|uniref:TRAFAC clade GTPase domain-containing protein n=1 Tax=Sphingomonas sp. Mn802worker TaxID=629773 RepID=UPI0012EA6083|nr:hypothetical protein [Sphingomonas sp. Mn802worker]
MTIDDFEEIVEAPSIKEATRMISLASGEALDTMNAAALQRRLLSRVVGLVGPNNAGKTSLIASVYDLLQEGPVGDIGFAGSTTLIGFEKVCHDARAASRRGLPHMERTIVGAEATFFHLDLKAEGQDVVSLFLGDRSGEDYLGAADDVARADDFIELRRADTVTLLVNGEHLTGTEHRHEVRAVSPQLIEALVEGGAIREHCRLAVVLTKNDVVVGTTNAERTRRDFAEIVATIAERHSSHLSEVKPFVIAASPKSVSGLKRGDGVDNLLRYWLSPTCNSTSASAIGLGVSSRMMDLLAPNQESFG